MKSYFNLILCLQVTATKLADEWIHREIPITAIAIKASINTLISCIGKSDRPFCIAIIGLKYLM